MKILNFIFIQCFTKYITNIKPNGLNISDLENDKYFNSSTSFIYNNKSTSNMKIIQNNYNYNLLNLLKSPDISTNTKLNIHQEDICYNNNKTIAQIFCDGEW